MIVVDASAVLEVLLRTRTGVAVEQRLLASSESLHAPHVIDLEVVQVLRRHARMRQMSDERAQEALDDLAAFPLTRWAHDTFVPRIWELRARVTAYDAAYVALAEALEATLVTCDARLSRTTGHRARIEVAPGR